MASITIKNIPDSIYERLKKHAAANRRSLNSEIIHLIEQAVTSQPVDPEVILERARQLRENGPSYRLSDEEFNQAKRQGRS
jgi:plasmid stability protein